jgi:hypothetical protein
MIRTWKTTPKEPFPTTLTHWYWMSTSDSDLPSSTCSEITRLGSRSATRAFSEFIQLLSCGIAHSSSQHSSAATANETSARERRDRARERTQEGGGKQERKKEKVGDGGQSVTDRGIAWMSGMGAVVGQGSAGAWLAVVTVWATNNQRAQRHNQRRLHHAPQAQPTTHTKHPQTDTDTLDRTSPPWRR